LIYVINLVAVKRIINKAQELRPDSKQNPNTPVIDTEIGNFFCISGVFFFFLRRHHRLWFRTLELNFAKRTL
jgi:hypothetical protein